MLFFAFAEETHDYDIALLKVKSDDGQGIKFNDYVQPACLPTSAAPYTAGTKCYISGWGGTGNGDSELSFSHLSFLIYLVGWESDARVFTHAHTHARTYARTLEYPQQPVSVQNTPTTCLCGKLPQQPVCAENNPNNLCLCRIPQQSLSVQNTPTIYLFRIPQNLCVFKIPQQSVYVQNIPNNLCLCRIPQQSVSVQNTPTICVCSEYPNNLYLFRILQQSVSV